MNIILLTAIICTVALIHGGHGQLSFDQNDRIFLRSSNNAYDTFVHRHILADPNMDKNSNDKWASYLTNSNLCGRTRVQSFIDASEDEVQQICRDGGWRVENNLCISNSPMTVYDAKSEWVCGCCFVRVTRRRHNVVVACNNVGNRHLPVHYQKYTGQLPTDVPCSGVIYLKS